MERSHLLRIETRELEHHPRDLDVDVRPVDLDLPTAETDNFDVRYDGRVTGRVTFRNGGGKIFAEGTLRAVAVLTCGRCLDPVRLDVVAPVSGMYEHNKDLLDPAWQFLGSDEGFVSYYDGSVIFPEPEFREAILLETPMLTACAIKPDGCCEHCGKRAEDIAPGGQKVDDAKDEPVIESPWKSALKNLKVDQ